MRFTSKSVAALEPRTVRFWINDTSLPGFRVAVLPSGVKSFAVRLRSRGGRKNRRDSTHVIGRVGQISLEQARDRARELLSRATLGEDVAGGQRATRVAPSVAELSEIFLEDREGKLKARTLIEYRRAFKVEINPVIGSFAARDVTRRDVAQLHHGMRTRPYMANRVVAVIGSLYSWAERHGYVPEASRPVRGLELFPEKSRERYLTDKETLRLGSALRQAENVGLPLHPKRAAYLEKRMKQRDRKRKATSRITPANPFAVAVIRFLLLSGWREREAMTLRWDALDLDAGRARLAETKSGLSWRDLGGAAVALLRELPRIGNSPFVFPGHSQFAPISTITHVWFAVRHSAGLDDVRLHDLRHNFASEGAQQGKSLLVLGAVLGHREIETTKKYAHMGDRPGRSAANDISATIDARLRGKQTPVHDIGTRRRGRVRRSTRTG